MLDAANGELSFSASGLPAGLSLGDPGNQSNIEGAAVAFGLASTDNLAAPTYSATGLPTGLSVNSSTGVI